ncbi:MAG: lysylphosphatidylglycerol synthase domain-containing protein [Vicinamibacterales bacterium]
MLESRRRPPLTALGVLATAGGLILFVWCIRRIGLAEVRSGFAQIGWGLVAIVLLGGVRFALRALAWILCVEPPHRLPFSAAFGAVIAGDALGNLLPLGPIVSEPTKAAFVRGRLALGPAGTALAIENVIYTLSVAAMIAAGMAALLFVSDLPSQLREVSEVAIGAVAVLFLGTLVLLWTRPAVVSRVVARLIPGVRGDGYVARIRELEQQMYSFASRRGMRMVPLIGVELLFHAFGVLEAYITLWLLLGAPPLVIIAFIVETVNRLIIVVFKFIPLGAGVNEAGTAFLTGVLGLGTVVGTTIGLVRKVRMLCWMAVGTLLLVRRGAQLDSPK